MRIPFISLVAGSALALGGCAYGDMGSALAMAAATATARYGSPYYGAGYGYGYGRYGGYGYYLRRLWLRRLRRLRLVRRLLLSGQRLLCLRQLSPAHAMTHDPAAILDIALAGASHHFDHPHHDEAQLGRVQPAPDRQGRPPGGAQRSPDHAPGTPARISD